MFQNFTVKTPCDATDWLKLGSEPSASKAAIAYGKIQLPD